MRSSTDYVIREFYSPKPLETSMLTDKFYSTTIIRDIVYVTRQWLRKINQIRRIILLRLYTSDIIYLPFYHETGMHVILLWGMASMSTTRQFVFLFWYCCCEFGLENIWFGLIYSKRSQRLRRQCWLSIPTRNNEVWKQRNFSMCGVIVQRGKRSAFRKKGSSPKKIREPVL